MISDDVAVAALRALTAAFPSPVVPAETIQLYRGQLTQQPFSDPEMLMVAVAEAMHVMDRFPTIHQLLIAYQGAARGKIAQRQAAEQRAIERAGATTGGPRVDERYGAAMVDVIRTALAEALPAGDGARGHRHEPGTDPVVGRMVDGPEGPEVRGQCPVCSNADAAAEQMQARMSELLAERHVVPIPQPVKVSRCRHCGDDRMVVVSSDPAALTVKPCPECCPEASEAWANGDYGVRRGVTR